MAMSIGNDYRDKYAMFGALSMGMNNGGVQAPKSDGESLFGSKSVEGIGGQSEAGKVSGAGQFAGANLGFVQRLDRLDEMEKLNHPETKSCVEGYSNGLAEKLDLMA